MNRILVSSKPLKRLWRFFVAAHRAKAAVLMRVRPSLRDLRCLWRVEPNLERQGYSRSSLRDWKLAATVALMGLALHGPSLPASAAEAADTNAPVRQVKPVDTDSLAN